MIHSAMTRFALVQVPIAVLFATTSFASDESFEVTDTFEQGKHSSRSALRGEFEIANGVLKVHHDPELYTKYKDHGPIVIYSGKFQNGRAKLRFRLSQSLAVDKPARGAFTFDGEKGHVLRVFTMTSQAGRVAVWNEGEKKPTIVARDLPKVELGKWYDLEVVVDGGLAKITLAGKTVAVEHEGLKRAKTNAKYSTAFATMELDEFSIHAK